MGALLDWADKPSGCGYNGPEYKERTYGGEDLASLATGLGSQ